MSQFKSQINFFASSKDSLGNLNDKLLIYYNHKSVLKKYFSISQMRKQRNKVVVFAVLMVVLIFGKEYK